MEAEEAQSHEHVKNEHSGKLRRRAIDQLAVGSIIVLWGGLLILKQAGIIEKNVSTWPFPLAAFGILLVIGGLYKLRKSRAVVS